MSMITMEDLSIRRESAFHRIFRRCRSKCTLSAIVLVAMLAFHGNAEARAVFSGTVSGRLSISRIGTGSRFRDIPAIEGADLSGLVMTVDPFFERPSLLVEYDPVIERGSGKFQADATASIELIADDPFDIRSGEVIAFASAGGSAERVGSVSAWSEASAGASAYLHVLNPTDYDIYVEGLWRTCGSIYSEGLGYEGDQAWASIQASPSPAQGCWTDPRVYKIDPNSEGQILVLAAASGRAQAVPEPTSLVVWLLSGAIGFKFFRTKKTRRVQQGYSDCRVRDVAFAFAPGTRTGDAARFRRR